MPMHVLFGFKTWESFQWCLYRQNVNLALHAYTLVALNCRSAAQAQWTAALCQAICSIWVGGVGDSTGTGRWGWWSTAEWNWDQERREWGEVFHGGGECLAQGIWSWSKDLGNSAALLEGDWDAWSSPINPGKNPILYVNSKFVVQIEMHKAVRSIQEKLMSCKVSFHSLNASIHASGLLTQCTVKIGSSIWHVVCHSGCRWVNQLHTWIRIIAWQSIIKEHVTLIPLHIWSNLFLYDELSCHVRVCNWFTHLQPEWQTICHNDDLIFTVALCCNGSFISSQCSYKYLHDSMKQISCILVSGVYMWASPCILMDH